MKYSELISFNPIEDVIQLTTADNADKAREYVRTYVMSDTMAESLQAPVIDQLQMDEVVDNKGVLVVGNYGTGKSHLMSVISAIAKDADNLQYLQNKKFAKSMEQIAGKFEVLRIEIGGVTMSLREILFGFIQEDFDNRGIAYDVPDFSTVKDNKKLIRDMMLAFSEKYPDKGYLIVVDEFLSYLTSRNERDIVLDLEFFRALGEMCSKSNLRVIFGVQEKVFDNPRFSFVSSTLMHVKDHFTQIVITKEATSYVVSERILKKTQEQKALIRAHLEKFCNLYTGMSSRLDEFVDLFPIHPSYIDVFNKIYLIENRHILKNISLTIAYHIMQGIPVPLDATDFYRGLDERFLKRDNMYFLPDQVNEYDMARATCEVESIQFSLFVSDEKSAISWLYQQLDANSGEGPQTYQTLMPKFMQELKAVDKREKMPELSVILEENFLKDEDGKWYIPDLTKSGDIAKLREKNLLKEFQEYLSTKGKLKVFRSEAVRAGFAKLWKDKDYATIVSVAERLPEETIQEDQNLLMYYDISLSRV